MRQEGRGKEGAYQTRNFPRPMSGPLDTSLYQHSAGVLTLVFGSSNF